MLHILLKRKRCVACRSRMRIGVDKRHLGEGWHDTSDDEGLSYEYTDKTIGVVVYRCHSCKQSHEPRDLPEWRWTQSAV